MSKLLSNLVVKVNTAILLCSSKFFWLSLFLRVNVCRHAWPGHAAVIWVNEGIPGSCLHGTILPLAASNRWLQFMVCFWSKLLGVCRSAITRWAAWVYLQSFVNKLFKNCQRKEGFLCRFDLINYIVFVLGGTN